MRRALVTATITVLLSALVGAAAVRFGTTAWPIIPGIILLAHAVLVLSPIDAFVAAAVVGVVSDALGGLPIGMHVIAGVLTALLSRGGLQLLPRTGGVVGVMFISLFSAVHTLLLCVLLAVANLSVGITVSEVIPVAIGNGLMAVWVVPMWRQVQVWCGLADLDLSVGQRLGRRTGEHTL
jgi:hypothetical protein